MLKVTKSIHGMNCIELRDPKPRVRQVIVSAVTCNWMDDERYQLGSKARPFLQSDDPDYLLVEFWGSDYQPFVDLLNRLIEEENMQSS